MNIDSHKNLESENRVDASVSKNMFLKKKYYKISKSNCFYIVLQVLLQYTLILSSNIIHLQEKKGM